MSRASDKETLGLPREATDLRGASIEIIGGPSLGAKVDARREKIVIGSAEGNDLVLDDPTVSRFHCEIELTRDRATVRDLGSKNGTLVDRVAVLSAVLHEGAVLTLGSSTLRFGRTSTLGVPLSSRDRFGSMVGQSATMRRAFLLLERAAESDVTVLLLGETGTGKELAAESLHHESARRDGPFVVVDCSALPPDLLEAELFGHERGAYTGATHERPGLFETAAGGTLFLDEIGELPLELQPKLLRALERREVRRIGATSYRSSDVRVVAASNRDLRREVNEKRFRSDLYFRLAVLEVTLPPLRERHGDLPPLLDHLLAHAGQTERLAELRDQLLSDAERHPWPGNVRELRNYVERCAALRARMPIQPALAEAPDALPDTHKPLKLAREEWNRALERKYAEAVLQRHQGNVTAAAREAGVDRMYFYRVLWRHGLK